MVGRSGSRSAEFPLTLLHATQCHSKALTGTAHGPARVAVLLRSGALLLSLSPLALLSALADLARVPHCAPNAQVCATLNALLIPLFEGLTPFHLVLERVGPVTLFINCNVALLLNVSVVFLIGCASSLVLTLSGESLSLPSFTPGGRKSRQGS